MEKKTFIEDDSATTIISEIVKIAAHSRAETIETALGEQYSEVRLEVDQKKDVFFYIPKNKHMNVVDYVKILTALRLHWHTLQEGVWNTTVDDVKYTLATTVSEDNGSEKIMMRMRINNQKHIEDGLLALVSFGKSLVREYETARDDSKIRILLSLVHIESVLDSGRILLVDSKPEIRDVVTLGMDEIRAGIITCMKKGDKREIQAVLQSAGEQFKTNFISTIK